jgi:hypothetical protein
MNNYLINQFEVDKKFRKIIYPSIVNNILEISDFDKDVLIDHIMDSTDPINLVIVSKKINNKITIYLRSDNNLVRKKYNNFPLIVNTTNAKIVLINYSVEFVIDQNEIKTSLLCNNLHALHNSNIIVISQNKKLVRKSDVFKVYGSDIIRVYTSKIDFQQNPDHKINNESNFSLTKKSDTSLNSTKNLKDELVDYQIKNSFINMMKPDYKNDTSLSGFIKMIEIKSQIDYSNLKKDKMYNIYNTNGLIVDFCSDEITYTDIEIKGDIILDGKYINGVLGGYVNTVKNVSIKVDGKIKIINKDNYFSGVLSGISKWIDCVSIISDEIDICGKVCGIISGSTCGIFNQISCLNKKIILHDEKRFGTAIGFLNFLSRDQDYNEKFNFVYDLKVSNILTLTLKSLTSGIEYGIIGQMDLSKDLSDDYSDYQNDSNDDIRVINIFNDKISKTNEEKEIEERSSYNIINKEIDCAQDIFNLIKETRKNYGQEISEFPISLKKKEVKKSKRRSRSKSKNQNNKMSSLNKKKKIRIKDISDNDLSNNNRKKYEDIMTSEIFDRENYRIKK